MITAEVNGAKVWAERMQQGLQKALGHDLPNHLVAIQGMLRLLELEQGERLNADGRGYLKRLTAATARTQHLVRLLHLSALPNRASESWEEVPLAEAARGAVAEVHALYPDRDFDCDFDLRAATAWAPGRSFRLVLAQLVAHALQNLTQGKTRLRVGSTPAGEDVLVWVAEPAGPDGEDMAARVEAADGPESPKTDHLLSLVLVREVAAAWHAQFRADLEPGRLLLALVLPARRDA